MGSLKLGIISLIIGGLCLASYGWAGQKLEAEQVFDQYGCQECHTKQGGILEPAQKEFG